MLLYFYKSLSVYIRVDIQQAKSCFIKNFEKFKFCHFKCLKTSILKK